MNKLLAAIIAATFAVVSFSAVAADTAPAAKTTHAKHKAKHHAKKKAAAPAATPAAK